ncbi:hypothetical protein AAC387_Pa09g2013 [Persea americana]
MNYSSVHFIHTIIGGVVEKTPNIGPRGRPASRFKEIGAIYSPEVANSIKMPWVVGERVTRSSHRKLHFNDGGFIDETVSKHAEIWVDNKSCNDSDQHSTLEITLKEFKDRCKAKKQKVSKSNDRTEQDIDFSRKRSPYVKIKEEDSDLEETLFCWKQKLSKKRKVKRTLERPSQTGESHTLTKIKSEIIEMDLCDIQNVVGIDGCTPTACFVKANSSDNSSAELLDRVCGSDTVTVNEVSYIKKVDSADSAAELPKRNGIELNKGESTFFVQRSQNCCIPEVSTQYLEPGEPINILGATPKVGSLETTSQRSRSCSTSGLKMENAPTHLLSSGSVGSLFLPKDLDSEVNAYCQNHFSPEERHCDTVSEMPDLANVNLCCTKLEDGRCISDLESEGPEKLVDEVPVECEKSTEGSREDNSDPPDHSPSCGSHSSFQEILCQVGDNAVTQMCDMDINQSIWSMGLYRRSDTRASDSESRGLGVSFGVSINREMPDEEHTVPDVSKEDSVPCHENTTEKIDAFYTSSENSDLCFSVANNFHSCSSSLPMSDNAVTQICDMDIDHNFQSSGLYNESDRCTSDLESEGLGVSVEVSMDREITDKEHTVPDIRKEDSPPRHENTTEEIGGLYTSSQNFDLCFSITNNFHSCNRILPTSEKMLSSPAPIETILATVEEAKDSSSKVTISHATNKLMETDACSLKRTRPPEKLLSTRKVISPMSQEKLRRAAEDGESCDKIKVSKNGKNQCLEKWTGNKASSQTCFEEAEFMIKKLKNRKNSSPPPVVNNIVKTPHVSCLASCSCSQCTWIDEHSQKAITFSQRQMHDIETLATRLINGLKSMKDIIKDALLSEAFLSVPSKYTIEEINAAAKETDVLEDSTRKWLAMMTKDCNRFCKIMTSTTNKAATTVSSIQKEQKKVTFADEIGGVLCHVKIMEGHPTFA